MFKKFICICLMFIMIYTVIDKIVVGDWRGINHFIYILENENKERAKVTSPYQSHIIIGDKVIIGKNKLQRVIEKEK